MASCDADYCCETVTAGFTACLTVFAHLRCGPLRRLGCARDRRALRRYTIPTLRARSVNSGNQSLRPGGIPRPFIPEFAGQKCFFAPDATEKLRHAQHAGDQTDR